MVSLICGHPRSLISLVVSLVFPPSVSRDGNWPRSKQTGNKRTNKPQPSSTSRHKSCRKLELTSHRPDPGPPWLMPGIPVTFCSPLTLFPVSVAVTFWRLFCRQILTNASTTASNDKHFILTYDACTAVQLCFPPHVCLFISSLYCLWYFNIFSIKIHCSIGNSALLFCYL